MNILFLTLAGINNIDQRGIYPDLIKYFVEQSHKVCIVSPIERKEKKKTHLIKREQYDVLRIKTLNIQKTKFVEKALGIFLIDFQFKAGMQKHIEYENVDLVIYTTPPITLVNSIQYLKKKYNPYCYLLLKDIFPQNALDLQLISRNSILYTYFRNTEKRLYNISNKIGCMSVANVEYILKHNTYISRSKVEVCPNSITPNSNIPSKLDRIEKRKRFGLPTDKTIFIYGGNLGKPQGVDFIVEFLNAQIQNTNAYFIILGSGTEYYKIENWILKHNPENVKLISFLPKKEYDDFQKCGDIGLVFLDHRFTIPNFPSRILPYMDDALPIIAVTDIASDIGSVIVDNNFGKHCLTGDLKTLNNIVEYFCEIEEAQLQILKDNSRNYLINHYTSEISYNIIMNAIIQK